MLARERRRRRWAAGILLSLPILACGENRPSNEAWSSLVETEHQFAAVSAQHGMKVAFLRYLDDDSILFRPHPVDGKQHTQLQPESDLRLTWSPNRAHVGLDGTLGWTTGPFRVEPGPADAEPILGYFVSLWKRQPNKRWKVVVDLGTVNPPGETCFEPVNLAPPEQRTAGGSGADESSALMELERSLAERSRIDGVVAAFGPVLGPRTRIYRDGTCPAEGERAAAELLDRRPGALHWEPTEAHVSPSGDLAYTLGSYEIAAPTEEEASVLEQGYYVRVWQRGTDGAWWLAVDVTSPVPQPAEP